MRQPEAPEVVVVAQRLRGQDFGEEKHFHAPTPATQHLFRDGED